MNKKGFSFTLDVTLGLLIAFLILSLANFYVVRNEVDIFPQLQVSKTGNDILNIFDRLGYFDPPVNLDTCFNELLPSFYGMSISGVGDGNCTFNVGDDIPENVFIASGSRFFTIKHEDYFEYCLAEFRIWQK